MNNIAVYILIHVDPKIPNYPKCLQFAVCVLTDTIQTVSERQMMCCFDLCYLHKMFVGINQKLYF